MSITTLPAMAADHLQYGSLAYGPITGSTTGWYQKLLLRPALPGGFKFPTLDQITRMILDIEANSATASAAGLTEYGLGSFTAYWPTFTITVQTSYHATPQSYTLYVAPTGDPKWTSSDGVNWTTP